MIDYINGLGDCMKQLLWAGLLGLITLVFSGHAQAASGPSFDCHKASTKIEKAICSDSALSKQDAELAIAYRRFLKKIPERSRSEARQMQRLWIQSRNALCQGGLKYLGRLDGVSAQEARIASGSDVDLPSPTSRDTGQCLKDYYHFSLTALQKGVLFSVVVFHKGQLDYPVDVDGIDHVVVKKPAQDESGNCANSSAYQYILQYGKSSFRLDDAEPDYYGCLDKETRSLRLYMLESGRVMHAIQHWYPGDNSQCYSIDSLTLDFFDVNENGVSHYRGHKGKRNYPEIMLDRPQSCQEAGASLVEWSASQQSLIFTETEGYSDNLVTENWPEVRSIVIQGATGQALVVTKGVVDSSKDSLWGIPYKKLASQVGGYAMQDPNYPKHADRDCKLLTDLYDELSGMASRAMEWRIGHAQVFFIMRNIFDAKSYATYAKHFEPAAKAALGYLQRMKSTPDWEARLVAAENYRKHVMEASSDDGQFFYRDMSDAERQKAIPNDPYIVEGFPRSPDCFYAAWSPAAGMDLNRWLYLFWYRRVKEGNVDATASMLQKVVRIADGASN